MQHDVKVLEMRTVEGNSSYTVWQPNSWGGHEVYNNLLSSIWRYKGSRFLSPCMVTDDVGSIWKQGYVCVLQVMVHDGLVMDRSSEGFWSHRWKRDIKLDGNTDRASYTQYFYSFSIVKNIGFVSNPASSCDS